MAKVIIFGIQDIASLAHYYLTHDSDHDVVAFCVNEEYIPEGGKFEDKPVVAFENIESQYPVDEFSLFAPMSEQRMNRDREAVFNEILKKGYQLISYVSSKATVFDNTPIGKNCFILEDNTIQPYTSIGDNVVLWSGNHIGHHSVIGDHVFFTSHVVLAGHCSVEPNCFFGINATVKNATLIAEGTLVAMSATINKDTEAWGIYRGDPAEKARLSSKKWKF